jgi:hypothetical protein
VVAASFSANPATAYEADSLLVILAFYLAVGYLLLYQLQPHQSMASRLLGPTDTWILNRGTQRQPSVAANLALRLLQIHVAIWIVASGLQKLQSGSWWAGWALWYPLHPPFTTTLADLRAIVPSANSYLSILSLGAYVVLAWQIGFPLFAWHRFGRILVLVGAAIGWIWTGFVEDLPLLGPAVFVACLSFVSSEQWHKVLALGLAVWGCSARYLALAPKMPGGRLEP